MSFFESVQERRLKRAASRFLREQNTNESRAVLYEPDKFQAFCDECVSQQGFEGPFADAIGKLIQSFIDDPEKWIKIIQVVIAMFAAPSDDEDGA